MIGRVAWGVILSMLAAWEVVSLVHDRFPTLGDVLRFFLRPRGGRYALFLGWLWLGWHFLIRYNPTIPH
jgi:Family of unknown function (DUF6186)